ncbi:MAG: hypothetical protein KDA84_10675, partial [Planctomycetaceae bacterium]|nr:hypothetical protein [Planctomycetaceae bacterium]
MNRSASFLLLLPVFALIGCGPERFPTAPASGEVTYNGKRVTGGTITLVPINEDGSERKGKPALGDISQEGLFELTTYEKGDGAMVGKHRVVYTPPENIDEEEESETVGTNSEGEEVTTAAP